ARSASAPRTTGSTSSAPAPTVPEFRRSGPRLAVLAGLGDLARYVRREVARVALLQLGQAPVATGDEASTRGRAARAHELVVVVRVGHRVVEADLFTDFDVAHRDYETRSDDPAVRFARVVHQVGGHERRRAHHVQLVVDLQGVGAPHLFESVEL